MRVRYLMTHSLGKSKRFLIPTLFWLAFLLVTLSLLSGSEAKYHSLLRTLLQWDAQHYLSIAERGYEKFPCPWNPNNICGNIGWFPFYPMLGKLVGFFLSPLGLDVRHALLLTSWLSLWLALVLLFRLVEEKYGVAVSTITLAALLAFPTSFYFLTGFPYALYFLLAVLVFHFFEKKKYLAAVFPAGLLAVTYPSGVVIGLPILYLLIARWKRSNGGDRIALIGALAAIVTALLLYAGYYWWKFDDFWLYQRFQAQSYYAHQLTFPLLPLIKKAALFDLRDPVLLIILLSWLTVLVFYSRRVPPAWQIFMFGVLLFTPAFGTTMCYYRHIVVAFPLFLMVGLSGTSRIRRWVLLPYFLVSLYLGWKVYLSLYAAGMLM